MENTGTERINLYVPKGTLDRIKKYHNKPGTFTKNLLLSELDKLEKLNTKN